MTIHNMAVIHPGANIAQDAEIGPFVVIGEHVSVGSRTKIGPHAVIDGHTKIGNDCRIFPGASIGLEPQSISYKDQPTGVVIGNRVIIREYATIHRATGEVPTIVGDDCFLMNYVHIAHDCKLGKGVIMANSATLAGHIEVGDGTVMAGSCIFHQYVRIGRLCMVSGLTGSRMDLPPFSVLDGLPPAIRGINIVGMRRHRISAEVRAAIKHAYRTLYRSGLNFSQAINKLESEGQLLPEVAEIVEFYKTSKRGVLGLYAEGEAGEPGDGQSLVEAS